MHSYNSIKNTWQNINSLICNNNRYANINELKKNDTHLTDPKEISDIFNDFFVNVGFRSNENIPTIPATHFSDFLPLPNPKSIYVHPIKSEEILSLIGKLKNDSPGYDEFLAKVVKAVATLICEPLAFIFNNCKCTGTVPCKLNMAKVTPVSKGGNNLDVNNYGPISVLPVFSKILEEAIFNRLCNLFIYSNVFYNCQFGFLPGRSTTHILIHLTNKITEVYEDRQFGYGTFLDLSLAVAPSLISVWLWHLP